jgi:hypothetical protein
VHRWEKFATRVGMNRTKEGLHFQTQAELEAMSLSISSRLAEKPSKM